MSTKAELACVYSALILADDDVAVTVSNLYLQNHVYLFLLIATFISHFFYIILN